MIGDPSLHADNPQQQLTQPGQAHFADPSIGANCGDCLYFFRRQDLQTKRFCCLKAKAMAGNWRSPISSHAMACKYFERRA